MSFKPGLSTVGLVESTLIAGALELEGGVEDEDLGCEPAELLEPEAFLLEEEDGLVSWDEALVKFFSQPSVQQKMPLL